MLSGLVSERTAYKLLGEGRSNYRYEPRPDRNLVLKRQTRRDRMRARLRAIKEELTRRMHVSIPLLLGSGVVDEDQQGYRV